VLLWKLKLWPKPPLPPRGFVGQVSSSFRGIELRHSKRRQIQLTRLATTGAARLWRLTCVWEIFQPASPPPQFFKFIADAVAVYGIEWGGNFPGEIQRELEKNHYYLPRDKCA